MRTRWFQGLRPDPDLRHRGSVGWGLAACLCAVVAAAWLTTCAGTSGLAAGKTAKPDRRVAGFELELEVRLPGSRRVQRVTYKVGHKWLSVDTAGDTIKTFGTCNGTWAWEFGKVKGKIETPVVKYNVRQIVDAVGSARAFRELEIEIWSGIYWLANPKSLAWSKEFPTLSQRDPELARIGHKRIGTVATVGYAAGPEGKGFRFWFGVDDGILREQELGARKEIRTVRKLIINPQVPDSTFDVDVPHDIQVEDKTNNFIARLRKRM